MIFAIFMTGWVVNLRGQLEEALSKEEGEVKPVVVLPVKPKNKLQVVTSSPAAVDFEKLLNEGLEITIGLRPHAGQDGKNGIKLDLPKGKYRMRYLYGALSFNEERYSWTLRRLQITYQDQGQPTGILFPNDVYPSAVLMEKGSQGKEILFDHSGGEVLIWVNGARNESMVGAACFRIEVEP